MVMGTIATSVFVMEFYLVKIKLEAAFRMMLSPPMRC